MNYGLTTSGVRVHLHRRMSEHNNTVPLDLLDILHY